jgi:predicted CoA-binding protein
MSRPSELVRDFLAQRRIAVAGVSRDPRQTANFIFRKLRDSGHEVLPVNPRAKEVEGVPCYPDLRSVPAPVDSVMIVTRPEAALEIVRECSALGITRVWMHRSFGTGSVSDAAVRYCREHGIRLIDGSCPAMFCEPVDFPHRCMRWILGAQGKLPR